MWTLTLLAVDVINIGFNVLDDVMELLRILDMQLKLMIFHLFTI